MTEGAETGKIRFFVALYSERKDMYYFETPIGKSRWYAKQGACKTDAFLAECECKRRGWVQSSDLTEALKVAGEALRKAERAIYNLAYKGTERIQDLGGECDSAEKTGAIAMREAGIEESRAALERIRTKGT